jgi:hypothetical protein
MAGSAVDYAVAVAAFARAQRYDGRHRFDRRNGLKRRNRFSRRYSF